MRVPYRRIRAAFDEQTVTVYQAYAPEIAAPAVAASKLGQERVLAVRILRSGSSASAT
ncbi:MULTISPECIES: DUF4291 family protein [unclassified Solwaraspora]|uniref:DUF4291 family protein n=1 Tax=unclassified Solwaraspora TaxID=2627926 RepID=UPI00259BB127|nr:DUF4291 family protein [Solwaraspora sp. WMMA2056]WJK42368.1 DUF4291 family protein [Solwaraspora sp. WMMA2056]